MKIVRDLEEVPSSRISPILSIGAYDGVHLGHQEIVRQVVQRARPEYAAAVVLSFSPHPQKVVSPSDAPLLLQTASQRNGVLGSLEVDYLVEMPFTRQLSQLSPDEFVSQVLMRGRPTEVHVGWNFRFGHKRSGDLSILEKLGQQHGFAVFSVPPVSVRGVRISSSKIRRLLAQGHVSRAARFLGRPYQILGTVVEGDARGRQIGFPTANLETPNELIPANGVYVGQVRIEGRLHPCLTNVGLRPTVQPAFKGRPLVESHILDFESNIYGHQVELEFFAALRPEKKFESLTVLTEQIRKDVSRARRYLERTRPALFVEEKLCPSAQTKS